MLVSFPPLTDMLKFSGLSWLIRGRELCGCRVGRVVRLCGAGGAVCCTAARLCGCTMPTHHHHITTTTTTCHMPLYPRCRPFRPQPQDTFLSLSRWTPPGRRAAFEPCRRKRVECSWRCILDADPKTSIQHPATATPNHRLHLHGHIAGRVSE